MSDQIVILPDSPDAATHRSDIRGWIDRHGKFFGDEPDSERLARWSGSTHSECECGAITKKSWTKCDACRENSRHERWLKMPVGEWDGNGIIYSDILNEYLEYWEVEEKEKEMGPLDLILCDPVKLRLIDEECWCDELALEDGYAELPEHVLNAIKALNKEIEKMKPVTFQPGKYRIEPVGGAG